MLRAGMIKRLAAGIYTWMPLGLRVLRRVEAIVREEMNRAGAIELLMPVIQPAELWQESGRWEKYGPDLLRIKDRHQRDFVVQPTSEEVITDIARRELKSYKQLPVNLYHIQTKFRDEVRPRFGVMRSREFIMKDAYSFDADKAAMQKSYQAMYDAYMRIFTRLGLSSARCAPIPARSAARHRTNSRSSPIRVKTQSRIAPTPTTPRMSSWRRRRRPAGGRRQGSDAKGAHARASDLRAGGRIAAAAARAHGQVHHAVGEARYRCCSSEAITRSTKSSRQSRRACRAFAGRHDAEIEAALGCSPGIWDRSAFPPRCR